MTTTYPRRWATEDNPALCAGNDANGDLFRRGPKTAQDIAHARAVCFACPHRTGPCLNLREQTRRDGFLDGFRGVWAGDYYGKTQRDTASPMRGVTISRAA